jgi:arylformamidase
VDRGDGVTLTHLEIGAHTGTHIDAPSHFIPGGATMDEVSIDLLMGPARVVHALDVDALSAVVLERLLIPHGTERLLFRTRNSDLWARGEQEFREDFVAIPEDGARWLVEHGVRLVGVDYLSVGAFSDPVGTHRILLGAGVIAVEGLDLSGVEAGEYTLVCLPLRIEGSEAAPARAILIE